jgi:hypothetical protein
MLIRHDLGQTLTLKNKSLSLRITKNWNIVLYFRLDHFDNPLEDNLLSTKVVTYLGQQVLTKLALLEGMT